VGSRVDIRNEKHDWSAGLITNTLELNGVKHVVVKYRDSTQQL
jgi:hypothetical protein